MAYVEPPLNKKFDFCMEERIDFVPKGWSPILKNHPPIDETLSQPKKEKLQQVILESYQNELLLIKWANYLKKGDPKTFFEEVYKDKTKLYEQALPKLSNKNCLNDLLQFTADMLNDLVIIGQVDQKFIAVLQKNKNLIMLFDQHAIHERVRLENLLKVYASAKSSSKTSFMFFISQIDIELLKKHVDYMSFVGLEVNFFNNGINVLRIPLCLNNRFSQSNDTNILSQVVQSLINEILDILKSTTGAFSLPKIIVETINLEACRGAIKFGDHLTRENCKDLLEDLTQCNLPFQCAHGRPSVTPLLNLNTTSTKAEKINWKKLLHR